MTTMYKMAIVPAIIIMSGGKSILCGSGGVAMYGWMSGRG